MSTHSSTDPSVTAVLAARRDGTDLVLATSGTSGSPRLIRRTTESWWSSFEAYSWLTEVRDDSRVWIPGPLTATMNLFGAVHAAVVGARLVERAEEASHALLTPAQLDRFGSSLGSGTVVTVAGDALPSRTLAEHPELRLRHYYGAAELSFVAAGGHAEDLKSFPGADLEVRNGEIWARSSYLCKGYLGGTGPLRRDGDWATVGDRGVLEGGRLRVLGRPESIVTAGATVRLADVEAALAPRAVGTVWVVGTPHPAAGQVVTALVTDTGDAQILRAVARELLPATHRPRRWFLLDTVPLTGAGKPDRTALARAAASGELPRA